MSSPLENKRLNLIPVGRQLQRTPPTKNQNLQISYPSEDPTIKDVDPQDVPQDDAHGGQDDATCHSVKEERKSYGRSSLTPASAKNGNTDADAFIQGMQGYRWTDADLEFIYQAKQQKRAQQLQQELSEVEKTLQAETQRLELAVASRDQLQSELSKIPSCGSMLQLCKSILSRSRASDQLDGLGEKALLSLLNLQDVQRAVREENAEVSRLERKAARAQELRDKEEKAMKEMEKYQKKISTLQLNVDALKVELAELNTQLSEKEEASKAARAQGEVRKAAKAQTISDAPKTPEENDTEETNRNQASVVSQVTDKVRKGSRRAKPTTKVLKETSEKETKEKAGKDTAKEGKVTPKEKAPKQVTSRKTTKKEMAPNETASQVKIHVETDPEKMLPKVTFSNVPQVLEKCRTRSRMAKTSAIAPNAKGQKKMALTDSTETEMVPMEMAENVKTAPKIKAPKKRASKKTAEKQLPPDETASQEKTPEEMAPEEVPPKVKASNVAQVLEKGSKGSRSEKSSTTALKEKASKKSALRKTAEKETPQFQAGEKVKTARKVNVPRKVTSVNSAKKEMALKETASHVKTLYENVLEEMTSKVQTQKMTSKKTDDLGMVQKETVLKVKAPEDMSPVETAPKVKASKLKASKKTSDMEKPVELTDDGSKVTKKMNLKIIASKKTTSAKRDMQEMPEDESALKEALLKEGQEETSKKKTAVKNKVKKEMDPEKTDSELTALKEVDEEASSTKTASKVKAPEEMPGNKTTLKETASRKRATKEKVPKQKAVKNSSEHEIHFDMQFDHPSETKDSLNVTQAPRGAQRAARPHRPQLENDPVTVRRSKRNTAKNPSLSKTMPEKTTGSIKR